MEYSATTAITCLIAAAAFSSFSTVSVAAQNQTPVASSTTPTVKPPVQSAPTASLSSLRSITPDQSASLTVPCVPVKTSATTTGTEILQPPCAPGTGPGAPTTPPIMDARGTTPATPSMPAAPGSPAVADAIVPGASNPAPVRNK